MTRHHRKAPDASSKGIWKLGGHWKVPSWREGKKEVGMYTEEVPVSARTGSGDGVTRDWLLRGISWRTCALSKLLKIWTSLSCTGVNYRCWDCNRVELVLGNWLSSTYHSCFCFIYKEARGRGQEYWPAPHSLTNQSPSQHIAMLKKKKITHTLDFNEKIIVYLHWMSHNHYKTKAGE